MPPIKAIQLAVALAVPALLASCANDPLYIPGPSQLEGGMFDDMGNTVEARASLDLPIELETAKHLEERTALAAELMMPLDQVPYVRVGDIEVSVEWTVKNLEDGPGEVKIQLNGANEYFEYDPTLVVLSDDDEAPPSPGLEGDIPLHVPPLGTISGLFREDQLREASVDLDQITRGNVNPFRATLTVGDRTADSFQPMTPPMPDDETYVQMPTGPAIPRAAFAQLIRVNLVFKPNRHMVMEYAVRVRDTRGILHELLDAATVEAPGELQTFAPVSYVPAAAAP